MLWVYVQGRTAAPSNSIPMCLRDWCCESQPNAPFVAPPTIPFSQFGHQQLVQQQLAIHHQLTARIQGRAVGELPTQQGIVG